MFEKINHYYWKVLRKARQLRIAHSSCLRPSSEPFISGDSFRALAQHIHDNTSECSPTNVSENDIVFVAADRIESFFEIIHPQILKPYKLITHNGDRSVTEHDINFIDEKVKVWFAQNVLVSHPKLIPIPIGLENAHYAHAGVTSLYTQRFPLVKNGRILLNFSTHTNPEKRLACKNTLMHKEFVDVIDRVLPQPAYVQTVSRYSAVASPEGNGPDCHRTWEALYCGVTPLVPRTIGHEYFVALGIPMQIVDSWADIPQPPTSPAPDHDACLFAFWKNKILQS